MRNLVTWGSDRRRPFCWSGLADWLGIATKVIDSRSTDPLDLHGVTHILALVTTETMMEIIQRSLIRDLILAVEQNDQEQVDRFLAMGLRADMPYEYNGRSAFHAAVEAGHLEMVRYLIERVQHPDFLNNGTNLLSFVIHELGEETSPTTRQRWLEIMECLLEAGADPAVGSRDQEPIVLSRLYGMNDIELILEQYMI